MPPIRIPFDSLCLAAAIHELRAFEGARVQKVVGSGPRDLSLQLYAGRAAWLRISCDPIASRVCIGVRPGRSDEPPPLLQVIKSRIEGSIFVDAVQAGFDRVVELRFESEDGVFLLVAEPIGPLANLILVGPDKRVLCAFRRVQPREGKRSIMLGRPFEPLASGRACLISARDEPIEKLQGSSPFLVSLIRAMGVKEGLERVRAAVRDGLWSPVESPGSGVYPIEVAPLGLPQRSVETFGVALDHWMLEGVSERSIDEVRSRLSTQIERVLLARDVAIKELEQAELAAATASRWQRMAELVLAYQGQLTAGARTLDVWDYDGEPISISVNPELTAVENAQRYFERARHAKDRQSAVEQQLERIRLERSEINSLFNQIETCDDLELLSQLEKEASKRKWLMRTPSGAKPEDRPFDGKRVKEFLSPGGFKVLVGENAEANDYLLSRLSSPNDWWLHVRGSASAHVVIRTDNQPDRVGPEVIKFAAELAVRHSTSKHSAFVPVDITLRKYVRKPRGAPAGFATYSRERTVHVELS